MAALPIYPVEARYRRVHDAPCAMACAFCVVGAQKRHAQQRSLAHRASALLEAAARHVPPAARVRSRLDRSWSTIQALRQTQRASLVLRTVDQWLEHTPLDVPIRITADDLLEFPRFFDVLERFQRHHRRLELVTPGLRLADAGFAAALRGAPVQLTLTYLTNRSSVSESLTGRADAVGLIRQALSNLKHNDVDFGLNCVITARNVSELSSAVRYVLEAYELPGLALPGFYLEQVLLDVDPQAFELFASYPQIEQQLLELVDWCEPRDKRLSLVDLPPCQFDRRLLQSRHLLWQFAAHTDSPTPSYRSPACAGCPLDGRCNHIPEGYLRKYGTVTVDPAELIRTLPVP